MSKPLFICSLALSSVLVASPLWACSPSPEAIPSSIEQRMDQAALAFEGVVKAVEGDTATITVTQYFKGQGDMEVKVSGFNTHSCSTYLEPGQQRLFFAKPTPEGILEAVYDGAFGATLPMREGFRERIESNRAQNAALQDKNCAALFDGQHVFVPCVKIAGSDTIYRIRLDINARPGAMSFDLKEAYQHIKPEPKPPVDGILPFYAAVESVDINVMESMPLQVSATVNGYLRDGCETLSAYDQKPIPLNNNGDFRIDVTVNPPSDEDVACTQAIERFTLKFPLEVYGLRAGVYNVNVNNSLKTSFELTQDNLPPKEDPQTEVPGTPVAQ